MDMNGCCVVPPQTKRLPTSTPFQTSAGPFVLELGLVDRNGKCNCIRECSGLSVSIGLGLNGCSFSFSSSSFAVPCRGVPWRGVVSLRAWIVFGLFVAFMKSIAHA